MTAAPPKETALSAALAVAGLLAAVVPYLPVLPLVPNGDDAVFWTWFTDPHRAGWWRSVLLAPHFIGYRPVTAVSFALTGALGNDPRLLHGVDLALHVGVGLALVAAWRALDGRAGPWAWLAALLFWASPTCETVVPYVARRSYSLATLLAVAAVAAGVAGVRGTDARAARLRVAAVGLLLLASWSNETAFVAAPVLALAALGLGPTPRAGVGVAAGAAAATAVAATARALVVHGVGGYGQAWVAVVKDGERVLLHDASPASVLAWAATAAAIPDSPSGDPTFLLATAAGPALGLGLAGWAAAWSLARARAGDRVPLLLATWVAGGALLPVVTDTWFPRMAYPVGVPAAAWLAWMLRTAVRGAPADRWHLVPLALVLAARVQRATPIRGLDRPMIREQFVSSRLVRRVGDQLRAVEAPALVWVATNLERHEAEAALHWIRLGAPLGVEVRLLTVLAVDERPGLRRTVSVTEGFARPVPEAVWAPDLLARSRSTYRDPVPLPLLRDPDRPTWVLDGDELLPIPEAP